MQHVSHIDSQAMPLFHCVRNDHPDVHYFAYYLEYLTFHMPERLLVPALRWLVRNGIIGAKFLGFIEEECNRSGLELIRYLTMRLEKEKQLRALTIRDIA